MYLVAKGQWVEVLQGQQPINKQINFVHMQTFSVYSQISDQALLTLCLLLLLLAKALSINLKKGYHCNIIIIWSGFGIISSFKILTNIPSTKKFQFINTQVTANLRITAICLDNHACNHRDLGYGEQPHFANWWNHLCTRVSKERIHYPLSRIPSLAALFLS